MNATARPKFVIYENKHFIFFEFGVSVYICVLFVRWIETYDIASIRDQR